MPRNDNQNSKDKGKSRVAALAIAFGVLTFCRWCSLCPVWDWLSFFGVVYVRA
jgi:hypothetical protein